MDLQPGEVRAVDGKLIVGCAAGSVLLVMRARVVAVGNDNDYDRS